MAFLQLGGQWLFVLSDSQVMAGDTQGCDFVHGVNG
jgi:hypothetical protein